MYMLPLRFVTVGKELAICATRIVSLITYESNQARSVVKRERKAGNVINACGRGSIRTVIFLDNGTIVISPYSINRILNGIETANTQAVIGGQHYLNSRNFINARIPIDPEEPPTDEQQLDMNFYDDEQEDDEHEDCESDSDSFETDDE